MNDKDKIEWLENALENLNRYATHKRIAANYLQGAAEIELTYTQDKYTENLIRQRYQYNIGLDRAYKEIQTLIEDTLHEYDQQAGNAPEEEEEDE